MGVCMHPALMLYIFHQRRRVLCDSFNYSRQVPPHPPADYLTAQCVYLPRRTQMLIKMTHAYPGITEVLAEGDQAVDT